MKSSTLVFELRALADRLAPQSNFDSCLALIGADTLERVRAFCADHGDGTDLPYPEREVWENAIAHVLAALEGKSDG